MKPAPFDYAAPTELADAVAALAELPETARVLAGGQSLVLEMHYRRERPALLVDINNVRALDAITVDGDALRVGALARHRAFETPSVAPGALGRLLSRVSPFIAHPPVRARGTMAGSLAWANPASEWCATAVALDAAIELTGPAGSRTVAAGDYFLGPFRTARQPDEILTSVRLPLLSGPVGEAGAVGVGFCEQHRTHASFAQVAVVAVLTLRQRCDHRRPARAGRGGRSPDARARRGASSGRPGGRAGRLRPGRRTRHGRCRSASRAARRGRVQAARDRRARPAGADAGT